MIIETKSGARYEVAADTIEAYTQDGDGYVYGTRINAKPNARFKRGRGAQNGDIRWFHMKNVKLIQ